jgi:hypothetical protein
MCAVMEIKPRLIALISGPINTGLDKSCLFSHYVNRVNQAIERSDHFVIEPITSCVDADALEYLSAYPVSPDRVTIFVTKAEDGMWGTHFRSSGANVKVVKGQMSRDRDAALTSASTYDILRVQTKEEGKLFYGHMWQDGCITNTERTWKPRRGIAEIEVHS